MASTASTNFVTQLFETVLLRQGSASEISSWANVLDGGLTQNEVVTDFVTSVEATTDVLPIVRLYQTFFNRAPDAAGLNFWVNTLRNSGAAGSTGYNNELVSIATFFAGSAESQSLYGATPAPASFVAALYQDVLGRAPDVAGDQFWINFLTSAGNTPANEALVASFFANSQEFVTDSTAPIEAFLAAAVANGGNYATGVIAGLPNAGSGSGQLPSSTFILTPGADTLTGVAGAQNTFEASLTQFGTDGKGPTLNSTDVITGGGGDNNTLLISDDFGQATDIIPLGIHLSNIQTVSLQTSGNAGSAGTPFSTAGISGVTTLTVTSVGTGTDYINAAGTTAITENQRANGGGVSIAGGSTVTVTSAGANGVQVGTGVATTDPTGAVKVTDSATNIQESTNNTSPTGSVVVYGGTNVSVNLTQSTNNAGVRIGSNTFYGNFVGGPTIVAMPTGNVTVTDAGGGNIAVLGGVNVSVTTAIGGQIRDPFINNDLNGVFIGDATGQNPNPTGAVAVVDNTPVAFDDIHNTHATSIYVEGGTTVNVTTNAGGVNIGSGLEPGGSVTSTTGDSPTGAVTVTDTANDMRGFLQADVSVDGGTSVSVTVADAGVRIGQNMGLNAGALPSDAISVTETAARTFANIHVGSSDHALFVEGQIDVDGGTSVTISAMGQDVLDGFSTAASGAVTVTQSAVLTGAGLGELFTQGSVGGGFVLVGGGTSVSVTTTGGSVQVGTPSNASGDASNPTGAVTVVDTYSGVNTDSIAVFGGTTVTIDTTPTDGSMGYYQLLASNGDILPDNQSYGIQVGLAPNLNASNTGLTDLSDDPTGDVVINNSETFGAVTAYGTAEVHVYTNGAASVTVTGGDIATVMDVQATQPSSGIDAGKAIGTSTLTTVVLDHALDSNSDLLSDALSAVTVLDEAINGNTLTLTDHTRGYALTLTVGNDEFFTLADGNGTMGSVTIRDNGVAAAAPHVVAFDPNPANRMELDSGSLTTASFANSAALDINLDTPVLATITASGSGALNLGDVSGLASLASIDASASTGMVTVDINPGETSFKGGKGIDVVTLDQNTLGANVSVVGGSSGSNVLVANYAASANDTPLGNNAAIKNFQTLALGDNAINLVTGGTISFGGTVSQSADNFFVVVDERITYPKGSVTDTPAQLAAFFANFINGGDGIVTSYTPGDDFFTFTDPQNVSVSVEADSTTITMSDVNDQIGYDAAGFSALSVGFTAGDVTFINVDAGATLAITGSPTGTVGYDLQTLAPVNALSLTVGVDGATFTGTHDLTATVAAPGIQTVSIDSQGYVNSSNDGNNVTIGDSAAKTITITGDQTLTLHLQTDGLLGQNSSASLVTSISATGSSGTVDVSDVALAAKGGTIVGGAGMLIADGVSGTDTGVQPQVDTVTITTVHTGDEFTETINGTAYQYKASNVDTANTVAQHLAQAVSASGLTVDYVSGNTFTVTGTDGGAFTDTTGTVDIAATTTLLGTSQQDTVTFAAGTTDLDDTFTETINGVQYLYVSPGGESETDVATNFAAQLQTDNVPVTAIASGNTVTLTGGTTQGEFTDSFVQGGTGTVAGSEANTTPWVDTTPQLDTITINSVAAGEEFTETVNGVAYSYTAGGADTTATVAAGLEAAIGANVPGVTATYTSGNSFTLSDSTDPFTDTTGAVGISNTTAFSAASADFTGAVDSITTGSGGGDIAIGSGGGWNPTLNSGNGAYDVGSETINLAASAAVADTLVVNTGSVSTFNGSVGGVTGFNVTASSKTSDQLAFGAGKTALVNNGSSTSVSDVNGYAAILLTGGTNLTNLTWSSSNGVITFSASGNHNISEFSTAQLIAAAEIIVDEAGANMVAAFAAGGNTFVVSSGTSDNIAADTLPENSVTELLGVTGITGFTGNGGFETTAATGTIVTNDVMSVDANNGGSPTTHTTNDAGYSLDEFNTGAAGVTNTFSNLAAAAELKVDGAHAIDGDLGNLVVTQIAPSGGNSLTLNFLNNDATLDLMTVTGDNTLTIANSGGVTATITSLVDATNTVTTIDFVGSGDTIVNGITGTALTTIDSTQDHGNLQFSASQAGLAIKLSADGGSDITAAGAGDVITQASDGTGGITLNAMGAGDTITLGAGGIDLTATGAGDVISVGVTSLGNSVSIVATGAGDTINIADGNFAGQQNPGDGNDSPTTVGLNATINLGDGNGDVYNQKIIVSNDLTGATSSGSYAFTTINFAQFGGSNEITFNNGVNEDIAVSSNMEASQVNVAMATSLGNALDIAAAQGAAFRGGGALAQTTGLIDWFQYGGDTYIVEAINPTGSTQAHLALGSHDAVVKLTGLVDLNGSQWDGSHTLMLFSVP